MGMPIPTITRVGKTTWNSRPVNGSPAGNKSAGMIVAKADRTKMAAHAQVKWRLIVLKMSVSQTAAGVVFLAKYSVKYRFEIQNCSRAAGAICPAGA